MFQKSFPVLLVDDDPDVLSVSKLALRGMTVFGVPLDITVATSKAEAIEVLKRRVTSLETGDSVAPFSVALIDVVMETNTAGLELCAYIRETLKDKTTQLYGARPGRPGAGTHRDRSLRHQRLLHQGRDDRAEALHRREVRRAAGPQRGADGNVMVADRAMIAYSAPKEGMSQVLKWRSSP